MQNNYHLLLHKMIQKITKYDFTEIVQILKKLPPLGNPICHLLIEFVIFVSSTVLVTILFTKMKNIFNIQ